MGERRLAGRQQPGGLVEEARGEGGEQLLEGEDGRRGSGFLAQANTHDEPIC